MGELAEPAGDDQRRVHLRKLTLTDFRNYDTLSLDLGPGPVILTGENGAGKTNLMEAVSLLSPGRGLRRATLGEMTRDGGAGGFAVHARIASAIGDVEIGTGALAGESDTSRKIRINGAAARGADDLLEWLRVLWLTPSMDALFTGPAGDRRRFVDRLVLAIDPLHGRRAADYEKAMRARNRLLAEDQRDERWYEAIEAQMAETGTAIAAARLELVRLIAGMIERQPEDGPFPRAQLALSGAIEILLGAHAAVEVEDQFRRNLGEGRGRDRAAGRTLEGPHRSDLLVRHAPKDMPAELCSTGEQKALLIGIVLSQARLTGDIAGFPPILLLDEIAAHLDPGRRAALFGILEELGCQYFATGTEAQLFAGLSAEAQFLSVSAGKVTASSGP